MKRKIDLGVNLDHVATLREARKVGYPDFKTALRESELGGADGITVHLREDRRHIQESDVWLVKNRSKLPLNLEMSLSSGIVTFALKVKPPKVCLVPEKRAELTTEGGLDVVREFGRLKRMMPKLKQKGIEVSLFVDPSRKQLEASQKVGADMVELHTGTYANKSGAARNKELKRLIQAAKTATGLGLGVNAGHGLTLENVGPITRLPNLYELNIGHSIVARAVFVGLKKAVQEMKQAIQ